MCSMESVSFLAWKRFFFRLFYLLWWCRFNITSSNRSETYSNQRWRLLLLRNIVFDNRIRCGRSVTIGIKYIYDLCVITIRWRFPFGMMVFSVVIKSSEPGSRVFELVLERNGLAHRATYSFQFHQEILIISHSLYYRSFDR